MQTGVVMNGGNNMDTNGEFDVRLASLQQRVIGIESSVQSLSGQMSALVTTINERSRTPWGVLFAGAGVMVTILVVLGSLASLPIREGLTRVDRDIAELRDDALSVGSFLEFKGTYENNRITNRNDNDAKFAAAAAQTKVDLGRLDEIVKVQVPRAEHERVWQSYDQRFADQQRQVDEVKTALGSVYNARDVILDLRERLDRVERGRSGIPGS